MFDTHNASDLTAVPTLPGAIVGSSIIHVRSATSTMDEAGRLAQQGAQDGTVVISDEQTSGRGRHNREWVSRPGEDLLLSVILRPRPAFVHELPMIAALAAREAAASVTGFRPTLKWPNDVRVDGRKLCGVLAESSQGFQGLVTTIGIGLNVNMEPETAGPLASDATSLRQVAGRMISRFDVLATLLGELDSMYADLRAGRTVYPEWRSSLETIGLEVEVSVGPPDRPERVVRGTAIDADQEGRLLVRDSEGIVWPMAAGEVTLQSANPGE